MESSPSESIADSFEKRFPNAAGRKVAALTRKNDKLLCRADELSQKLQEMPTAKPIPQLASKEFRKLARKLLETVKASVQISEQIKRELNQMRASLGLKI